MPRLQLGIVGKASGSLTKQMQQHKDERVKLSSDAIAGIRVVKYYGWEQSVVNKIRAVRAAEMAVTRDIAVCKGVTAALGAAIPSVLSAAMFTIFSLTSGANIEADQAAMTIVLVNVVKTPLHILPICLVVMERLLKDKKIGKEPQQREKVILMLVDLSVASKTRLKV